MYIYFNLLISTKKSSTPWNSTRIVTHSHAKFIQTWSYTLKWIILKTKSVIAIWRILSLKTLPKDKLEDNMLLYVFTWMFKQIPNIMETGNIFLSSYDLISHFWQLWNPAWWKHRRLIWPTTLYVLKRYINEGDDVITLYMSDTITYKIEISWNSFTLGWKVCLLKLTKRFSTH